MVSRWAESLQNDFAARLDWCVAATYQQANHRPRAVVNGDGTREILRLEVKSGDNVQLSAAGSSDPDGQAITCNWFAYPEAGTLATSVELTSAKGETTSFPAPAVSRPETVHLVLSVVDEGSPRLFTFRRVVITIQP